MPRPLLPGIPGKLAEVSRWRRLTAALGAIAVVALAVGIILSTGLAASSKGASTPTKNTGSATVQRRDLVETDTESGTLSYANPQTVFNRLSGTITSLPAIGQVKKPGQTLYKVDGVPVVLFDGTLPAYRDLSEGVTDGPDVQELKQNLVALGFDPNHQITINQTYDAATAAAVDNWQSSLGETQTGTVTLGQVVFLPGPQRITSVDTVLGSTGGASGSGSGSSSSGSSGSGSATGASTTVAPARPEFVSLTTTPAASTPAATTPAATTPAARSAATTTPTTTTPTRTTPTAPCTGSSSPSSTTTTPTTTTPAPPTTPNCDQHTSGNAGSGKSPTTLAVLLALLKAETLELKKSGSSSSGSGRSAAGASSSGAATGSRSGSGGGGGGSGASSASSASGASAAGSASSGAATAQAILQTTSTQLVVTVDLDATKQTEAVVGEPVTVELPDGSNADGKITAVSPVAQTASSSSSSSSGAAAGAGSSTPSATVPVTITLTGHRRVNGLDQAAVSVNFEQQKANNVLSVPVTALVATAGGGYAVQEAAAPQRLVAVTPGLFAAGYVQISGSGVFPGLQVTDSQG